ncbi:hypothetical protein GCM10022403_012430 [Streptomyces coacervatus]|uniref:SMODS and SLOG-associating 2TM effector domain-containing protein n=1 Tax=Streptomyces coacervatus TaxID=647381 RepID=A0ABP7H199_9ACTN|nr:DUF4231 domain-containing protein [Streptomyces coacervatus]MDF2273253.1 DUF4231 domain-containing protein [Streptomyces coacervatus]
MTTDRAAGAATQQAWDQQSVWSQAAGRAKAGIDRARTLSLVLGLAAAVLGTAASQVIAAHSTLGKALAFGAACATGLVPIAARYAGPAAVRDWTRLRVTSESLKSEIHIWLAGVTPYRASDAQLVLHQRLKALREEAAQLLPRTAGIPPVPRRPPAVSDVETYIELCLRPQISGYYLSRARTLGSRAAWVRRGEVALGSVGVLLGALAGTFELEQAAAWVAVATTAGAAIGAHGMAANYAYQQVQFTATAAELEDAVARWYADTDRTSPAVEDAFVAHCERVISVLNDTWMAKWTSE